MRNCIDLRIVDRSMSATVINIKGWFLEFKHEKLHQFGAQVHSPLDIEDGWDKNGYIESTWAPIWQYTTTWYHFIIAMSSKNCIIWTNCLKSTSRSSFMIPPWIVLNDETVVDWCIFWVIFILYRRLINKLLWRLSSDPGSTHLSRQRLQLFHIDTTRAAYQMYDGLHVKRWSAPTKEG